MATVFVLPLHREVWLAKQLATLDVLASGRVKVGFGIGGRADDYLALGMDRPSPPWTHMIEQVASMRRVWTGEAHSTDGETIGPTPAQRGGPPLLAGTTGPNAVKLAASWADGVVGSALAGGVEEIMTSHATTQRAWREVQGRAPWQASMLAFGLGPDGEQQLRSFARDYTRAQGSAAAERAAASMQAYDEARLRAAVTTFEDAGFDELLLIPSSTGIEQLERCAELVAGL